MLKIRRRQHKALAPLPSSETGASRDAAASFSPQAKANSDAAIVSGTVANAQNAQPPPRSGPLKVRDNQMGALTEVSREEFIGRMETHLREHFGPTFKPLTSERLREFIVRNWKRADEYGLKSELGVCCYLETVAALGEDALAAAPLASRLRDMERTEMEKCEFLNDRVLSAWEAKKA